jgi:hypothetical protein
MDFGFFYRFFNIRKLSKMRKLTLIRFSDDGDSTLGLLFLDGKFQTYTLEDEYRNKKVSGETRIPAGTYTLGIRDVMSGLTKKYRNRYSWFKYHLHVKDVPNFKYVYIHIGNNDDHTDACILVGRTQNSNVGNEQGQVLSSRVDFKKLYEEIYDDAKQEKIQLEIIDMDKKFDKLISSFKLH